MQAQKSKFCADQVDYLGYVITREGLTPQLKKNQAILSLGIPKNIRGVRRVLGIVQYYRDLWPKRSEILAPLTEHTSTKGAAKKNYTKKIVWTDVHQIAFDKMKQLVARDVLLAYPQFDKPFQVYTDASDLQLGGVIMQEGRPLAYYSRKLNSAQKNYTTGEKEFLSVVETLKEFRNILFGFKIEVLLIIKT